MGARKESHEWGCGSVEPGKHSSGALHVGFVGLTKDAAQMIFLELNPSPHYRYCYRERYPPNYAGKCKSETGFEAEKSGIARMANSAKRSARD